MIQQTSSNLPANVFKIHVDCWTFARRLLDVCWTFAGSLLKVCWKFAGCLLDRVNTPLDRLRVRLNNILFLPFLRIGTCLNYLISLALK